MAIALLLVDVIVNLNFIQAKMWHPTEPAIEEEDNFCPANL